jgi:hypothetical protein
MSAIRNWTIGETSVSCVSPSSSRNVVMIETTAMKIGTTARNEAKTKVSTASAPRPPSTASSRTPGPSLPPLCSARASKPVRCTGRPPTVAPSSAARAARSALGFSPKAESGSGCG